MLHKAFIVIFVIIVVLNLHILIWRFKFHKNPLRKPLPNPVPFLLSSILIPAEFIISLGMDFNPASIYTALLCLLIPMVYITCDSSTLVFKIVLLLKSMDEHEEEEFLNLISMYPSPKLAYQAIELKKQALKVSKIFGRQSIEEEIKRIERIKTYLNVLLEIGYGNISQEEVKHEKSN